MSIPPATSFPNTPGWSRWIERLRAATAGRFTIVRELGRGGFAAVFLAQQLQPSRRVAIKLLLPAHLDSQWALEHFRGESQKIAEWRHQSVVTIYEVHEVDDLFFFVMSYVEGGSLHDLIGMLGPLSVPITRSVLAQMGSALQYAHRQGVTHRDIKPHNVLVDIDGGAVVTDFGISKQSGGTSHTVTGMIFGTAPYMAPEQCESGTTSILSDQYALGIVVYEMMTGSPPFTGPATSVLMAHLQKEVPLLRTIRPDCPADLEAAVARMLAKNPNDRFPSIAEAIQAAGAVELMDYNPERKRFAQAAREIAARSQAHVLELVSIPPTLEVGDKIPLQASAKTMAGVPVAETEIRWTVDNRTVAQLDEKKGELTALKAGFTTLFVQSGSSVQQVRVDIKEPQAASIQLAGPTGPIRVGETAKLTASARSKHGLPVSGPTIWVSEDPKLATVTPDGVLQALGVGRTRIRAQVDHVSSEFWVDVAPPPVAEVRIMGSQGALAIGESRTLSAVVLDSSDQVLTSRSVQWSSSDRRVATVSPTGVVTASAAGEVNISATCDSHAASIRLEVEVPTAVVVELVNPPSSLFLGDSVRLRAVARDTQGQTVERPLVWLSDDENVARLANDGTLTAIATGSVIVSASIDGVAAAAAIDITRRPSIVTPIDDGSTSVFSGSSREARTAAPQSGRTAPVSAVGATAMLGSTGAGDTARMAPAGTAPQEPDAITTKQTTGGIPTRWLATAGIAAVLVISVIVLKLRGGASDGVATAPDAGPTAAATPSKPATPPTTVPPAAVNPPAVVAEKGNPNTAVRHTLKIVPPGSPLAVGDTFTLHVSGDPAAIAKISWSSSRKDVVAVSSSGLLHARGTGRVSIVATAGDLHDIINVDVRAKTTVASNLVTPPAGGRGMTPAGTPGSTPGSTTGAPPPNVTTAPPVVTPPPRPAETQTQQPVNAAVPPKVEPPPSTTGGSANPANAASASGNSSGTIPVNDAATNERLVRRLVADYGYALSMRHLDDAVKLFPKMDAAMRSGLTNFFNNGAADMRVQYDVQSVKLTNAAGTARATGVTEFTEAGSKDKCKTEVSLDLSLENSPSGWHIVGLKQAVKRVSGCRS